MSDLPEGDSRTVLYALPEDQPDSLGEGNKSNPAWADPVPPGAGGGSGGGAPSKSATKAEWEAYASSQGVDTDGMTKDEIIAAAS